LGQVPGDEDIATQGSELVFDGVDEAMMVFQLLSSCDISALCLAHYSDDENFGPVWKFLSKGGQVGGSHDNEHQKYKNFKIVNELLWFTDKSENLRLCIPENRDLKLKIMFSEHDEPLRGHPGIFKTIHFIKQKYYWKNMDDEIKDYVASCEKCQRNKYRQTRAPGLLRCLSVPEARWQHITMDFITSLPNSGPYKKYNSIWVIVDRLTKRALFLPMRMGEGKSSARECADVFKHEYQRSHGIPETITSDRDVRFTSKFWQEFMKLQGTHHQLSSAFRPCTDGQTERTNRFIEDYLRNYVHASQDNWVDLLDSAEIAYNSRYHESIKMSPFEADLGYIPRGFPDHIFEQLRGGVTESELRDASRKQIKIVEQLKENLKQAQSRMKQYYDKNRPIQVFEIGDKVLLSTRNLEIEHLGISRKGTTKFGPLWIGPYAVTKRISTDIYELDLPYGLRLHREFHTSLLKPYTTDADASRLNVPNEGMIGAGGLEDAYLIEDVLDHKKIGNDIYYLVKWTGYPPEYNTWEPWENIRIPAETQIKSYLRNRNLSTQEWNPSILTGQSKRRKRNV
jgi:hypothetical protein